MAENSSDVALLGRIAATERKLLATCDLIPLANWGFDDSIHEKLRQQRNKLVNEHLTKKQKKSFSSAQKGRFARTIGVASTVSEVLEWMSTSVLKDVQPKAAKLLNQKPVEKKEKPAASPQAPNKEKVVKAAPSAESSSEGESDSEDDEAPTPAAVEKKPAAKPVATVKPTVRAEAEKEASDSKMDEGDDSSDEEVEDVVPKGAQKRKAAAEPVAPAKKTKVDKELEKYEKIDPITLDPIESRKVAMLKLQKKIEAFKLTRVSKKKAAGGGGKAAAEAENERKMKRRMSKLQLKQKRAEEKKKEQKGTEEKTAETSMKQEDLPRNDEGKVVYSKFDFIVKDPKKRLSTKEKKDKFTGKDYKSLLNKVEKRDEKLKQLKEKDPEKAKEMEEDIKWNRALKKAQGVKVKDNKELLKKGLKNKEKAKEKRLEKWANREQKVSADKSKKQDKRQTNLQKRVDSKKKSKMAKLRAKGRIL